MIWARKIPLLVLPALVVAGCWYDWTYHPPAATGTSPDAGTPEGGCRSAKDCSTDSFCQFPDGLCGEGIAGACISSANVCEQPDMRSVCTCDGRSVASPCDAAKLRADIDLKATCMSSGVTFTCPGVAGGCKRNLEYCVVKPATKIGSCASYAKCAAGPYTCDCQELPVEGCKCDAQSQGDGAVTVQCE